MFHGWGLEVEASDLSPAMIEQARAAFGEPPGLHWAVRGFDQPIPAPGSWDAVLCVGNSLALAPDLATVQTAIARMMEFTNFFFKEEVRPREAMQKFVLLLSPYAPHLAEELWQALSNAKTLAYEPWPAHDEAMLKQDTIEVPVQVNGKLRGRITVPTDATEDVYKQQAINSLNIKQQIKVVVVRKGKIVNIVLGKDSE